MRAELFNDLFATSLSSRVSPKSTRLEVPSTTEDGDSSALLVPKKSRVLPLASLPASLPPERTCWAIFSP
uniref:Uncharacterized protein n=1 Tax=Ascaris lumbricoides TaxID=6252 RepID=A0A0M3IGH0_ASCLU